MASTRRSIWPDCGCPRARSRRCRSARRRAPASRAAAWASAGSGRSRSSRPRRRAGRCGPTRGRSRWPPAASSRRGSAWGRSVGAPLPAGRMREAQVRRPCPARAGRPCPAGAPAITCAPTRSRPQLEALGVEADRAGVAVVGAHRRCRPLHLQQLVEAAVLAGAGHVGVGEQPLLDGRRGAARAGSCRAGAAFSASGWRPCERRRGGAGLASRLAFEGARGHARAGDVLPRYGVVAWRWFGGRCRCSGCRRRPGGSW